MAEPRFHELQEALLRVGVAPRHACRAVVEIESHFVRLLDEETSRGAAEAAARIEAHRRLGTNQELVSHYATRAELHAWSRRWPSICFTLLPLCIYLAAGFGTLLVISSVGRVLGFHLNRMFIKPEMALEIELLARVAFLWCLPLCVVAGFMLLAARRRVALYWPLVCSTSISVVASLCNVAVKVGDGRGAGEVGAGLGFSPETLPGQSLHAAVLVAVSWALLWVLRRAPRERRMN